MPEKNETSKPPMIASAMLEIMKELGAVPKGEKNPRFNYAYRGIDSVMNALHPLLSKHGVLTIPRVTDKIIESVEFKSGDAATHIIVDMDLRFVASDMSEIVAHGLGEGIDNTDKACSKAMQAAFKYALIQAFCIATGDMVDADAESPETKPKRKSPETKPKRKPPAEKPPAAKKPAVVTPAHCKQLEGLAKEYPDEKSGDVLFSEWLEANIKKMTDAQAVGIIERFLKREKGRKQQPDEDEDIPF